MAGLGILAPGFGLLLALLANVLCYRLLGVGYYEKHSWPKLAVLLVSGVACLVVGLLRKRGTPKVNKPAGNDLDARIESFHEAALDDSRDPSSTFRFSMGRLLISRLRSFTLVKTSRDQVFVETPVIGDIRRWISRRAARLTRPPLSFEKSNGLVCLGWHHAALRVS